MTIAKRLKKITARERNKHWLYVVPLVLASVFLLWKCRYGFGNVDESFYATIPYRLFKGDALFLHEWHLSQMAGVLTWPFVALYLLITQSTTGIILYLRYVCTLLQIATAVFLYIRLHKVNWLGAWLASLSYLLYIPFGIMALSYNSIAIMTLVISTTILFTAQKRKPLQYGIAGVLYAAAVLCCPYLAVVFVLYAAGVLLACWVRKRKGKETASSYYFLTAKGVLFLSIGAAIAAVLFAAFVFSRASLSDILKAFPSIMNDPEHPSFSLIAIAQSFFTSIWRSNAPALVIYPLLAVLFVVCLLDKKRSAHTAAYLVAVLVCGLALMASYYVLNEYINPTMWTLNVVACFIVLLTQDKTIQHLFYTICVTGFAYAFCLNAASNQRFLAISSAAAVSMVGSLMIIGLFACDFIKKAPDTTVTKMVALLLCAAMGLQLFAQTSLRYTSVFWEKDMRSQTTLIEDGFNAGLYVTEEKHQMYYDSLDSLQVLEQYDTKNVLFLSTNTWYYLTGDYRLCTYSAWLSGINEHSIMRLKTYFELSPAKAPDVVYVDKEHEAFVDLFCEECGYRVDRNENAIILVKQSA